MSNKIVIAFEVTNMSLMEETLKRLNHSFKKTDCGLQIEKPYYPITISKDEISCDSMNTYEVNQIKIEYQRDYQVHERVVRGETFEMSETADEIVLLVN